MADTVDISYDMIIGSIDGALGDHTAEPIRQAWPEHDDDTAYKHSYIEQLLEAVLTDSAETVSTILHNHLVDIHEVTQTKYVIHRSQSADKPLVEGCPSFGLPHMVAAMRGSVKCMELFLSMGVNMDVVENENNVVHALIWAAAVWPKKVGTYRSLYRKIEGSVSKDTLRRLLMQENHLGLRPIELAGVLGNLSMLEAIFNTEGIYRLTQPSPVLQKYVYYDVTDYHVLNGSRFTKSPFFHLMMLTDFHVKEKETTDFLKSPFIKTWVKTTMRGLKPLYIFGGLYALVYCMMVVIVILSTSIDIEGLKQVSSGVTINGGIGPQIFESGAQNCTYNCSNNSLATRNNSQYPVDVFLSHSSLVCGVFVIIESVMCILEKTVWFIRLVRLGRRSNLSFLKISRTGIIDRKRVASIYAIHVTPFIQSLIMLVFVPMVTTAPVNETEAPVQYFFIYYLAVNAAWFNSWNILYFCQMLPMFGYFIVVFQRMLQDFFRFAVVLSLLLGTYALMFYSILRNPCDNTTFRTFVGTLYTTFKVMLNMDDITKFAERGSPLFYVLAILHILLFMTITILVINYMIAVMSNTVSEMYQYKAVFSTLNTIAKLNYASVYSGFFRIRPALTKGFVMEEEKIFLPVWYELDGFAKLT